MMTEKNNNEEEMMMEEKIVNYNNFTDKEIQEQIMTEKIIKQEYYGYNIDDYAENQQTFFNAFDKTDPNFHKGDTREVPLYGESLPESMPTPYENGFDEKDAMKKVNVANFDDECNFLV